MKQQLNCLENVGLPETPIQLPSFHLPVLLGVYRPSDGNYHVPSDTWWQKQRPPIA